MLILLVHLLLPQLQAVMPMKRVAIVLHGAYVPAKFQARLDDDFTSKARDAGFEVIYPDSKGARWTAEDLPELDRMIDQYRANFYQVYLLGFSSGGMMTYRYACAHAEKLAGIVAVASNLTEEIVQDCHPSTGVNALLVHGKVDPLIPYEGGILHDPIFKFKKRGVSLSSDETLKFWKDHSGGIREVDRWALNSGHAWPNGMQYLPRFVIGPISHEYGSREIIERMQSWK